MKENINLKIEEKLKNRLIIKAHNKGMLLKEYIRYILSKE